MNHPHPREDGRTELQPRDELDLSDREERQVQQRSRPRAVIIHETLRIAGESELRRTVSALGWSGFAAGLSMGFSLMTEGLLESHLPDTSWRPLITNLGYSVGFLIVVMGRQQLFTENTLTVILPLLNRPNWANVIRVLRLWGIVLASNLLGNLLFAWIIGHTTLFPQDVQQAFTHIGLRALEGNFATVLWQGIFAGWLIALMVWLLPSAESSRIWLIVIVTYLVGLGGFAHVIAGSVEGFYVVTTGAASWGHYFGGFLFPALLGNILGGVSLVAALNYAQVVPESQH